VRGDCRRRQVLKSAFIASVNWHRDAGFPDQESQLMLDRAILTRRGGVFLNMTAEQYPKFQTEALSPPSRRCVITSWLKTRLEPFVTRL